MLRLWALRRWSLDVPILVTINILYLKNSLPSLDFKQPMKGDVAKNVGLSSHKPVESEAVPKRCQRLFCGD